MTKIKTILCIIVPVTQTVAEQKKTSVTAIWIAAWNSHDAQKVVTIFTTDVLFEDVTLGVVNHGSEELRKFAWPPVAAKSAGTRMISVPRGSRERIEPGNWSVLASDSPKFDVLATRIRAGSRTRPGSVKRASAGLSWMGPPGKKVPTGLTAEAPGMPTATTRPLRNWPYARSCAWTTPLSMIPNSNVALRTRNDLCLMSFILSF